MAATIVWFDRRSPVVSSTSFPVNRLELQMNRYMLGINALALGALASASAPAVEADTFSCFDGESCTWQASCTDDAYRWTALCKIQCMHNNGGGQFYDTSSATCGS
jgi:hypothetical protein